MPLRSWPAWGCGDLPGGWGLRRARPGPGARGEPGAAM